MQDYSESIQKELARLLPVSIIDDVACFVFFDNHPQDGRCIDITICTRNGEIKEFFQRDQTSYMYNAVSSPPTELIMMRNSESKLFYLMRTNDELFIVSSNKKNLDLCKKITEVDSFAVDDWGGDGQSFLRVIKKDDAVPIYFDDNFESVEACPEKSPVNSVPLFYELKRKYIEAQHSVNKLNKSIKQYINLRHASTLCAYQDIHPNERDSLFKKRSDKYGALKLKTQMPWVKVCNSNLIVALNVLNEHKEPIKELHILFTSATISSLAYSTKVFIKKDTLPYWKEWVYSLLPNSEAAVVAVMALDELQPTVIDQITVKGALSYKCGDKSYLMPFEDVVICSMMTYGDAFDAMTSNEFDADTMLAIISTTQKTELRIRLLTPGDTLINLLVQYLQMDRIGPDVVLYKKSPYHALNGAMLHFNGGTGHTFTVTAYTRTKPQLLSLIHSINNMVPAKTIITPINYAIHTKIPSLAKYSESTPDPTKVDYLGYAKTIVNRTTRILEYLDYSMIKMNECKDPNIMQQVGFQIDLYGGGKSSYKEFRDKMLEEEKKGVECLLRDPTDESMAVD